VYERAFGPAARPEVAARGYVEQASFWARLQSIRDGAQSGDFVYVTRIVGLESWLRTFHLPRATQVTFPSLWQGQTSMRHTPAAA
jgi:hypothetical protein